MNKSGNCVCLCLLCDRFTTLIAQSMLESDYFNIFAGQCPCKAISPSPLTQGFHTQYTIHALERQKERMIAGFSTAVKENPPKSEWKSFFCVFILTSFHKSQLCSYHKRVC